MTIRRHLLSLVLVSMGLATTTALAADPTPLRVAIGGMYWPLHGPVDGGALGGLEVELAGAIGQELGRPVVIVNPADFKKSSLEAVVEGLADISLNSVTPTPERSKLVDFTPPYVTLRLLLAARPGPMVPSLAAVKGRVAVATGPVRAVAEPLLPSALIVETPTLGKAFQKLFAGDVDYVVAEDVGIHLGVAGQAAAVVSVPFGTAPVALAAPKGQGATYTAVLAKLRPKIDALIATYKPGEAVKVPEARLLITAPENHSNIADETFDVTAQVPVGCTKVAIKPTPKQKMVVEKQSGLLASKNTWTFRRGRDLQPGDHTLTVTATCAAGPATATLEVAIVDPSESAEMAKPVVYLYPTTTQQVTVIPRPEDGITVVEPPLHDGAWTVTAEPSGRLRDAAGGTWSSLFWEGRSRAAPAMDTGFCVPKAALSSFFDDKLGLLGLRGQEVVDFKEFWMPRLQGEGAPSSLLIRFIDKRVLDAHAPVDILPRPDTFIRVYFVADAFEGACPVPEPTLMPAPPRVGFTAVEWGGRPLP